jgi:peptidoglycan/LPS O-acetylase OafA/YrhL
MKFFSKAPAAFAFGPCAHDVEKRVKMQARTGVCGSCILVPSSPRQGDLQQTVDSMQTISRPERESPGDSTITPVFHPAETFVGLERNNLFDLLRFIAAGMVIFSHSYPMTGLQHDPLDAASGLNCGELGVSLFFVLSGFLITRSWLNNPSITAYTSARCLRIFPGLGFSLLVTAFLIGPLCTSLTLSNYFNNPLTIDFLKNIFLFPIRYQLPGVFEHNPISGAVNGSLWSLPVEFMMYGVVLCLGLLKILGRKALLLPLTAALVGLDYMFFSKPEFAHKVELTVLVGPAINMAAYFLIGGCFYLVRERIPRDWRLAASALLLWTLSFQSPLMRFIGYAALPYVFFYLASLPLPALRKFAKFGDFSYGLYVFGFPVQQAIVHFQGSALSVNTFFLLAFTVSLLLSVISWHLVESPALKLKRKFGRRPDNSGVHAS